VTALLAALFVSKREAREGGGGALAASEIKYSATMKKGLGQSTEALWLCINIVSINMTLLFLIK
jgi:hypothetical protein